MRQSTIIKASHFYQHQGFGRNEPKKSMPSVGAFPPVHLGSGITYIAIGLGLDSNGKLPTGLTLQDELLEEKNHDCVSVCSELYSTEALLPINAHEKCNHHKAAP
jgi:hypothetical protein